MTVRSLHPFLASACEPEAIAPTDERVRILYLQPSPLFGGAERQLTSITPLLSQYGVDVLPVVGPGHVVVDWFAEQGVSPVIQTSSFLGAPGDARGIDKLTLPLRYLTHGYRARAEIVQQAREHDVDAILASLPFAWITGGLAALSVDVPIVWRAGGIGPSAAEKFWLGIVASIIPPDLLLCNAASVRDVFSPLVPAPVQVIPNGVDQRAFHPAAGDAARYRPPQATLVVGSAMRLAPSKRPRDFVQLAARLRDSHPQTRFLLAGEGGCRSELEQLARQLNADNLSFLGFVPDMQSFYRACDVLVLPSSSEGSPNFVLEAMAMRKALVLATIPPLLELVGLENAAWFPLGNVDQLTQSVSQVLASSELRRTLAERALLRVSKYGLNECAASVARMLRGVVAARRGSNRARAVARQQRPAAPADEKAAE
jgi:glycosyltransferase involved in cell wall biosynthesis